jgi:hypothetical protein
MLGFQRVTSKRWRVLESFTTAGGINERWAVDYTYNSMAQAVNVVAALEAHINPGDYDRGYIAVPEDYEPRQGA